VEIKEAPISRKNKQVASAGVYSHELVAEMFFTIVPQAMRIFREEMRTHRSGAMSIPQFRILAQLWLEPTSNKELASRLGVSGAAMSRMVDGLAKEGLVIRNMNKADRRSIEITLTKKGQIYFQKIRSAAILSLAQKLGLLEGELVDQMGAGLGLVSKALVKIQAIKKSVGTST